MVYKTGSRVTSTNRFYRRTARTIFVALRNIDCVSFLINSTFILHGVLVVINLFFRLNKACFSTKVEFENGYIIILTYSWEGTVRNRVTFSLRVFFV